MFFFCSSIRYHDLTLVSHVCRWVQFNVFPFHNILGLLPDNYRQDKMMMAFISTTVSMQLLVTAWLLLAASDVFQLNEVYLFWLFTVALFYVYLPFGLLVSFIPRVTFLLIISTSCCVICPGTCPSHHYPPSQLQLCVGSSPQGCICRNISIKWWKKLWGVSKALRLMVPLFIHIAPSIFSVWASLSSF